MSSYGYTHIGYYLIGKVRKVPSTEMVQQCENESTHLTGFGEFCPQCGGKVIEVPSTEMEELRLSDIPEEAFDGTMYDEVFIPEYVSPEGYVVAISNYGAGSIEIDDNSNSKIIAEEDIDKADFYDAFMDKHADHVSIIAEHVLDDVQIKFGIFRYYM